MVVASVRGTELIQVLAALQISRRDDLKKWLNRKMGSWRQDDLKNGLIEKWKPGARMIWRNGWIVKWTLGGMDALEKWMIFQFTPHHTKPPLSQNGCSSKNFSSNHPCCEIASAAFMFVPPNSSDDLCLLFCINLLWVSAMRNFANASTI